MKKPTYIFFNIQQLIYLFLRMRQQINNTFLLINVIEFVMNLIVHWTLKSIGVGVELGMKSKFGIYKFQ